MLSRLILGALIACARAASVDGHQICVWSDADPYTVECLTPGEDLTPTSDDPDRPEEWDYPEPPITYERI